MTKAEETLVDRRKALEDPACSARQKAKGRMSARERIALLFDEGTFHEMFAFSCDDDGASPGDGVITGYGLVGGRTVFCAAEDFCTRGGTTGPVHAGKVCRILDMAASTGSPFISMNDGGGARIESGVDSLDGYGRIFRRNVRYSGLIPQIAMVMGPAAGGACYSPALMDAVFTVKSMGQMFLTGPAVTKSVLFQECSAEELGGWRIHAGTSGVVHHVSDTEKECIDAVRRFISYLPCSQENDVPVIQPQRTPEGIVPEDERRSYDIMDVLEAVFDSGSIFEMKSLYARNAVTALARLDGRTVGVVANQPRQLAGAIDYKAAMKMSRFVRFCDCFGIPLVTFVDVPAFMPGVEQEANAIINHGAKMLYAYAEASVPMVTVILRKAFGGAYIAMGSKSLGADFVYAWPGAQIAVMGADGAVAILHGKRIRAGMAADERRRLEEEYKAEFYSPYPAHDSLLVDDVILPQETRDRLIASLDVLRTKKRDVTRHGNMPL